mgnify:CR=1 FL=1
MRRSFWRPAALALLLALALALRLYRLDGQSLWNDEGTSVALAARDLATITRNAARDIHPPLYYYALHFWVRLFGNSEVAVRSLSALYGALTVLVVCGLARRLYSWHVALMASALTAISPLQVYYSQEARMYAQVTLLGALSFWLFAAWADDLLPSAGGEAARAPRWRPVVYVLVTACALYSQYLALTLVAAQNALFLCRVVAWLRLKRGGDNSWRRAAGAIWRWAVSQLALLLLFLPWLRVAWPQLRAWPAVSEPFTVGDLLARALYDLSTGITFPRAPWVVVGCSVILIAGWAIARWRQDLWAAAVAWGYLLIPLALIYLLSQQRPMYNAKFVLLVAPAFALVLARAIVIPRPAAGSSRLARWLRVAWPVGAVAFLLGVSALSLDRNYHDGGYARDDYRAIARYIAIAGQAGDAILINAPSQVETFGYYYHGPLPVHPLPRQRPIDTVATERDLQSLVAESKNIYAILWATDESDPQGFIEGWLEQRTYKALDVWYGNLRFVVYAVPQGEALSSWQAVEAEFGPIRLRRYALLTPQATAGQVLQLSLVWEALSPLDRRYKVFVHVLDAEGHIVGQRDAEPSGGQMTPTWRPGEEVADHHGVLILPGTPPGLHQLAIGLYDLETGQRLPLAGGGGDDRLFLSPVEIIRPATLLPSGIMGIQHALDASADGLTLRGFNLTRLGEATDQHLFRSGDVLHLTLFWQLQSPMDHELAVSFRLLDGRGQEVWRQRYTLTGGRYPLREWSVGEIVRDQYHLFLPGDLREGDYTLSLSLAEGTSAQPLLSALSLRKLQIR